MITLFLKSQFKTAKYHPSYPDRFGGIQDAMQWARQMIHWYNNEHYHSGLNYFTPTQVHHDLHHRILELRKLPDPLIPLDTFLAGIML